MWHRRAIGSRANHMKLKRIFKWSARVVLVALVIGFLVGFIAYWRSTNECDRNTGAPVHPMKAILHCEYGGPEVLTLADVEKPAPTDNQILVRVRAASVNPLDLDHSRLVALAAALRNAQTKRHPAGCRLCGERLKQLAKMSRSSSRATKYSAGKTAPSPNTCVFWPIDRRVETGEHDI